MSSKYNTTYDLTKIGPVRSDLPVMVMVSSGGGSKWIGPIEVFFIDLGSHPYLTWGEGYYKSWFTLARHCTPEELATLEPPVEELTEDQIAARVFDVLRNGGALKHRDGDVLVWWSSKLSLGVFKITLDCTAATVDAGAVVWHDIPTTHRGWEELLK